MQNHPEDNKTVTNIGLKAQEKNKFALMKEALQDENKASYLRIKIFLDCCTSSKCKDEQWSTVLLTLFTKHVSYVKKTPNCS